MVGDINPLQAGNQMQSNKRAERTIKEEQSACVLRFAWVEVLQVRVQPASLSVRLAAAWRAAYASTTFACAKKPCVEVLRRPSPPSACVVDQSEICLSAYESSSSAAQSASQSWCVVLTCNTCFFRAPGFFPGDICVRGGFRKWHPGHSCLSRFLPSVFVFLFPYPDSIWMELNLEAGGWFWRSFRSIFGVLVRKCSPESLNLAKALRPVLWLSVFAHFACCKFDMCNQIKVAVYEDVFILCSFYKSIFNVMMSKCEQNNREKVCGSFFVHRHGLL